MKNNITQRYLSSLDLLIANNINTNVPFIKEVITYIISAGGKRIRPLILICMAHAMLDSSNNDYDKNILTLAAVIEFIHTATLLHDDVVDESNLRRAKPTVNSIFGNAQAVLVGDFIYSRAFEMMVGLDRTDIMKVLASTTNTIAEGEVLQLINIGNLDISLETYLNVIYYKTAKLFESSAELAVLVTSNNPEHILQAKSYGRHLGCAFQLIDDYLDYAASTEDMGKEVGDDIKQGKITMPLIYLLEHGNDSQKQYIRDLINSIINGKGAPTSMEIDSIISMVKSSNSLEYTKQQAIIEANKAKQNLNFLNDIDCGSFEAKAALHNLCDAAINRIA
jgi:octaprenyl-diphosphate synthase